MVFRYLLTLIRSSNLWRTNPATNKVVNWDKMERVTVRCVEGDEFITLSFIHGSKHSNLLRPKTETIERALERIKASVRKSEKKANYKRNKKAKTEHQPQQSNAEDDVKCLLLRDGKEIRKTELNKDAWTEGTILQIRERTYHVCKNIPAVTSLKLPAKLMVGCPIYPRIMTEFANHDDCSYVWYRSCEGSITPETMKAPPLIAKISVGSEQTNQSNQSNSNESAAADCIPMETNQTVASKIKAIKLLWSEVSRDRVFTPSDSMIGSTLKLECIPRHGEKKGDSKEVVSSAQVTKGPGEFPFEKRHQLTKEKAPEGW